MRSIAVRLVPPPHRVGSARAHSQSGTAAAAPGADLHRQAEAVKVLRVEVLPKLPPGRGRRSMRAETAPARPGPARVRAAGARGGSEDRGLGGKLGEERFGQTDFPQFIQEAETRTRRGQATDGWESFWLLGGGAQA